MGIIKKIGTAYKNRTTYRLGLLQHKSYRILKNNTNDALKHHGISSVEWAFLGLLSDNNEGVRSSEAAQQLGVEAAFVTQMVNELKNKNWIKITSDSNDSRVKILSLTNEGTKFVQNTETELRESMRYLIKGVSVSELMAYITVLEKIVENSNKK